MSLHLVFSLAALEPCRTRRLDGDVTVLLGDGVYNAGPAPECLVLIEDAEVRGVACDNPQLDYAGLVDLCTHHAPIVSWND
ncbi:MAG: hypothetical protein AAF513_17145 [Pseudomonadota bacterium]